MLQIGKGKLLTIVLVSVFIALLLGGCDTQGKRTSPTQITVTDVAGRQVSVTVPVKKVVLGYAKHLPTLAAVAGEDFPGKIVGWGLSRLNTMNVCDLHPFLKYKEKYPEIGIIPDVGSDGQGTFSVEKVISLKADVVIFPLFKLLNDNEGTNETIAKLEKAGIPTVFIDFFAKPHENTIPSTLVLGALLGKAKRAQEIVDFYQRRVNEVVSRLQKIDRPKPKVYVEHGSMGPAECVWTFGNFAWGVMVVNAGGLNITEGIVKKRWGPINPEYLLKTDVDVIIISGPEPPPLKRTGYHGKPEESRRILKAFTERVGWNNLSAVRNGRVYGVFNSYLPYNIYNFAVLEALAKWLYPDEFKTMDPEADLREFHKKFLPVDYSDAWMIGIRD